MNVVVKTWTEYTVPWYHNTRAYCTPPSFWQFRKDCWSAQSKGKETQEQKFFGFWAWLVLDLYCKNWLYSRKKDISPLSLAFVSAILSDRKAVAWKQNYQVDTRRASDHDSIHASLLGDSYQGRHFPIKMCLPVLFHCVHCLAKWKRKKPEYPLSILAQVHVLVKTWILEDKWHSWLDVIIIAHFNFHHQVRTPVHMYVPGTHR